MTYWYLIIKSWKVTADMLRETVTKYPRELGNDILLKFDHPYPESCVGHNLMSEGDLRLILKEFENDSNHWKIKRTIRDAIDFGRGVIEDFATENVLMGITQEGLTGYALENSTFLIHALNSGSLYEAYKCMTGLELDGVTPYSNAIKTDDKFFARDRLDNYAKRIAEYLGI